MTSSKPRPSRKTADPETIRGIVRETYGRIAETRGSCCGPGPCGCSADSVAKGLGYSAEDLAALPDGANLGLSCGNPTALASLKPGEIVLDLGAGAGLDVFLAARRVGRRGRAIGVDMTPAMLDAARRNAEAFRKDAGLSNVEFRLGEIEHLPVADASVDVVISNCVINLSPDKPQVWREIARVLRPGGRVAVSDLALLRPLPRALRESVAALTACVAGAVLVRETEAMAAGAGLSSVALRTKPFDFAAYGDSGDPLFKEAARCIPRGRTAGDYVATLEIEARKPAGKTRVRSR